jgi:c-di-GMP-binding flagellar brake protein YcgR
MDKDKRSSHRIPLELKITYVSKTLKGAHKEPINAKSIDLSQTGMRLKTCHYDPISDEIKGTMAVVGETRPISFEGKVLWSKELADRSRNSGVRFIEMSQIDKKRLEELIRGVWNQMLTLY